MLLRSRGSKCWVPHGGGRSGGSWERTLGPPESSRPPQPQHRKPPTPSLTAGVTEPLATVVLPRLCNLKVFTPPPGNPWILTTSGCSRAPRATIPRRSSRRKSGAPQRAARPRGSCAHGRAWDRPPHPEGGPGTQGAGPWGGGGASRCSSRLVPVSSGTPDGARLRCWP